MRQLLGAFALVTLLLAWVASAMPQRGPAGSAPPDLSGVYQAIAGDRILSGGLKNTGSPSEITLLPAAVQRMKTIDVSTDPEKNCQPIGPFRMMAREGTRIELVPAVAHGMIVMLFEDLSHGLVRTIYLNRGHPPKPAPNWLGDSVGRGQGSTLIVDTVGFNDRTWLNDAGAQHSDSLHLVEEIRPVLNGSFLEYKVTADDAKALARPYTYVRYYEKLKSEIKEDICEE
jgi:hypothetical protein